MKKHLGHGFHESQSFNLAFPLAQSIGMNNFSRQYHFQLSKSLYFNGRFNALIKCLWQKHVQKNMLANHKEFTILLLRTILPPLKNINFKGFIFHEDVVVHNKLLIGKSTAIKFISMSC